MDNSATIHFGRIAIEIPADCPDRSAFETVVRHELQSAFGDAGRAAFAKTEFDRCMDVREPFSKNLAAASHYQSAQLALSPAGKQWSLFEDQLNGCFRDYAEDGSAQEPAIPGWKPAGRIRIEVRPIAKKQTIDRGATQERER